jgi:hypothetical protein
VAAAASNISTSVCVNIWLNYFVLIVLLGVYRVIAASQVFGAYASVALPRYRSPSGVFLLVCSLGAVSTVPSPYLFAFVLSRMRRLDALGRFRRHCVQLGDSVDALGSRRSFTARQLLVRLLRWTGCGF